MPTTLAEPGPNLYFDYHDDDGRVVAQKVRIDKGRGEKTFLQRQRVFDFKTYAGGESTPFRDRDGRWWVWQINDDWIKALPYRPDSRQELIGDELPKRQYVTEGERDADAIIALGEVATTMIQVGYETDWAEYFRDYNGTVLIVVDNDAVGASQALAKRRALVDVGATVELLRPPEGYKDVRDLLEAGGSLSDLQTVTVTELEDIAKTAPAQSNSGDGYPEWLRHRDLAATPSNRTFQITKKKDRQKGKSNVKASKKRPQLDITNEAMSAEWLKENIGTGHLSGMFIRGDGIVHTPHRSTRTATFP